jgi:hypothetical protein
MNHIDFSPRRLFVSDDAAPILAITVMVRAIISIGKVGPPDEINPIVMSSALLGAGIRPLREPVIFQWRSG